MRLVDGELDGVAPRRHTPAVLQLLCVERAIEDELFLG
jgi:hypothetical protein